MKALFSWWSAPVGNDLDFNRTYTSAALDYLSQPIGWGSIANPGCYSIVAEQWLAACAAEAMGKRFTYLATDIFSEADDLGYCHLWGAKKDQAIVSQLLALVGRDHPEAIGRINNLLRKG